MRKLIRSMFRAEAERKKEKTSQVVHKTWELYQAKKFGAKTRVINEAKGTHKKSTWPARIVKIDI